VNGPRGYKIVHGEINFIRRATPQEVRLEIQRRPRPEEILPPSFVVDRLPTRQLFRSGVCRGR
jgi:hypothetical protein